jgi:hypothetical protein
MLETDRVQHGGCWIHLPAADRRRELHWINMYKYICVAHYSNVIVALKIHYSQTFKQEVSLEQQNNLPHFPSITKCHLCLAAILREIQWGDKYLHTVEVCKAAKGNNTKLVLTLSSQVRNCEYIEEASLIYLHHLEELCDLTKLTQDFS